jgi:hypothetical protein
MDPSFMPKPESQLRETLGIPHNAEKIILFAESSHWDPNWLKTSEQYYNDFIQNILDTALVFLEKEPRRRFSIECIFFLRMYWERNSQNHERIRELMNQGRLWMTSSGVTTADTLLPSEEALLRDFLLGQEWLRSIGVHQEPRTAYFTDSFGCTPALPSLLQAAGFERTAFTRIDGMYFAGCDYELARNFPREGSSAELLGERIKTQDFIWRDANGAEILCHWNAFNYGQGDLLAARGISRVYLFPLYIHDVSHRNVRKKIESYYKQLAPLARTPYHFCPIGFDFVSPIENLVEILDRYNQQEYPSSGIWAVNATLDDYLDLVDCYRDQLPIVRELDPNPYWTGFYSARPYLKKIAHESLDRLVLTERLAFLKGQEVPIQKQLAEDWWSLAVSNHHDFITGTSPDAVMEAESYPWLEGILTHTKALCEGFSSLESRKKIPDASSELPRWEREENIISINTPYYQIKLDEARGGCITHVVFGGQEMFDGISNDLVNYADSGGLWRMGHEFKGGHLKQLSAASEQFLAVNVVEEDDCLRVSNEFQIKGETILREYMFFADSPLVFGRITGRAPAKCTMTIRFHPAFPHKELAMAQPGGVVERSLEKIYHPTYWPMQSFTYAHSNSEQPGFAFFATQPTAVASLNGEVIEFVGLRNALRETAFGAIGIPANPASGFEKQICAFEYAFGFTIDGDWQKNLLDAMADQVKDHDWGNGDYFHYQKHVQGHIKIHAPKPVRIIALKSAHRGTGMILRLRAYQIPQSSVTIFLPQYPIKAATLCDARERDIKSVAVDNGKITLSLTDTITTLRLIFD